MHQYHPENTRKSAFHRTAPHTPLPRLLISGLSGGSGKTTVSLGLARYFSNTLPFDNTVAETLVARTHDAGVKIPQRLASMPSVAQTGSPETDAHVHFRPLEQPWETTLAFMDAPRPVQTFKKGPDYIDAAWLGLAGHCITKTLDPYFSSPSDLRHQFLHGCANAALALIEGNRGLYDGVDCHGTCSSAHLAKTLDVPVLLVVDCTKMTRTVAALVLGCVQFDKEVTIGGVILNRLGTSRQERIIREALAHYTDVPVLGALPRLKTPLLPERKMGLVGIESDSSEKLDDLCSFITDHVDVQAIWHLASMKTCPAPVAPAMTPIPVTPVPAGPAPVRSPVTSPVTSSVTSPVTSPATSLVTSPVTPPVTPSGPLVQTSVTQTDVNDAANGPVIGYVYDEAVWFYYVENLLALHNAGARLKRLSLFDPQGWESIDGLYVGGGQIEGHAEQISASPQLALLRSLADSGLPVFWEGSSMAVACREMVIGHTSYPMAGIFDAIMTLSNRPQGLGYTQGRTTRVTPFFTTGETIIGHQFNFWRFKTSSLPSTYMVLSKGQGLFTTTDQNNTCIHHDGLVHNNTCASLSHIFAPAMPRWAPRFVEQCLGRKNFSPG